MIINKIYHELKSFKGKNRLIFIASVAWNIGKILRDKTILTLTFIMPMAIKKEDGSLVKINHYWELPFYTYDYNNIVNQIDEDSLLIDIGAHFGEVTYRYLRKKKGFAHIFEANPNNCKIIKKLFLKENISNFKLHEFGLGNENKITQIYLANPLSYEGSLKNKASKKVSIKINLLDNIKMDEITKFNKIFFKIDVEGYELEVMNGMKKLLKNLGKLKKQIKLAIEIKNSNDYNLIKKLLKESFDKVFTKKLTEEDYLFEVQ